MNTEINASVAHAVSLIGLFDVDLGMPAFRFI